MSAIRRGKIIREDGSFDPADDFEDDGASFRVRREAFLVRQEKRTMWSSPRNSKEAVKDGFKVGLFIVFLAFCALVGTVAGLIIEYTVINP